MQHNEDTVAGNSTTWSGTTPPDGAAFSIGASNAAASFLEVNIAAVYVYNRVLSQVEKTGLYLYARVKGWLP